MSEHTPTPWRVGPDNVNPFYIAAPDQGMTAFVGIVPIPMQTGRTEAENRANAEFIVKAVNNHDALVKALEFFADGNNWMRDGECDPNSGNFRGTQVAQEALTRLVGGTPS